MFIPLDIRRQLEFRLRSLFVFTTVVGRHFSIAYSVGYEEATGILIGVLLIAIAVRWRRAGMFLIFLASFVCSESGFCGWGRWIALGSQSVSRLRTRSRCPAIPGFHSRFTETIIKEYSMTTSRIAADLEAPCSHRFQRS